MRAMMAFGALGLLLSACAAPVPDSAAGVGFGDLASYEAQRAQREAVLTGVPGGGFATPVPGLSPLAAAPLPTTPVPPGGIPPSALAAAGIGAAPGANLPAGAPLPGAVPAAPGVIASGAPPLAPLAPSAFPPATFPAAGGTDLGRTTGLEATPGNAAPALVGVASAPAPNAGGISDEQDFDAVASRESIESDAQRRAEAAAQYAVVQPQALPDAPANTGPDIVAYALNAPNARGQEWYSRFAFSGEGRAARNCADYSGPDEAQRDFLSRGGPDRDPRGLDPDGDGFACGWDPAPFRAAVGRG